MNGWIPQCLQKIVLGRFRIELIKGQLAFTREDLEVRICRRVPERPRSTAHGAVAIDHVVELGPNLEPDPTAMARALIAPSHLASLDSEIRTLNNSRLVSHG